MADTSANGSAASNNTSVNLTPTQIVQQQTQLVLSAEETQLELLAPQAKTLNLRPAL